ncbi:lmo0937 family membrane protein [Sulfuricurvum sp.]|uniref:lmo0937 family membrane protein n=1 Tax=Sulfuricurvum sp. TaxID=2025608 RepID=UPI00356A0943
MLELDIGLLIYDTPFRQRRNDMIETIALVLIILWILGFVTSYTMGGFIHILLVIAIVMILVRFIQGRRL